MRPFFIDLPPKSGFIRLGNKVIAPFETGETGPEEYGLRAIEQAALLCPGVGRAVASASIDESAEQWLLLDVCPVSAQRPPDLDELRRVLRLELPDFAVPNVVRVLDRIPSTPSGDVDRAALPRYRTGRPPSIRAALLRDLVAGVLGLPMVRLEDSFFDAGGHSLLVSRLVSQLRSTLRLEVSTRDVIDAQSIGELVDILDRRGRHPLPPMRPHKPETGPARGEALTLSGPLDLKAFRQAVCDLLARHEMLRSRQVPTGGACQDVVTASAGVMAASVFSVVQAGPDDAGVPTRFVEPADYPVRITLFEHESTEHVVLLEVDPARCDLTSAEILWLDLGHAYTSRVTGHAPVWELFSDHVTVGNPWQVRRTGATDPDGRLDHWRAALAGIPVELSLPYDRPRSEAPTWQGSALPLTWPADVHEQVRTVARRNKATVLMVMQAGFAALLARLGITDLVLGTTVPCRNDGAVGAFDDEVALRLDLSGEPSLSELTSLVRSSALSSDDHRGVPVGLLASELGMPSSAARHPLFQVAVELGTGADLPRFVGLTVGRAPFRTGFRLDLRLSVHETFDARGLPSGLTGALAYAHDVFERATALHIATGLTDLLAAATACPDRPVTALRIDRAGCAETADHARTTEDVRSADE